MKYRIKIVTYKNGEMAYFPQFKMKLKWVWLLYIGDVDWFFPYERSSREDALRAIDNHYNRDKSGRKIKTIDFEYITKPQK